ncbi:uncharacterized protein EV420DRAFT_1648514 [Desarmillaria tabescens]|uniref:Uncharacterized protein n=1 Tax=Armillaria tabescens TaxID=1929756 RepID=A0AA39JLJ9_ARMTA|nr:uncharacterized protein EV420DRAFT_1648514 [Desarmillaria tabescens]KAK0444996.1 hypothetical protein EV420DRAFT_1648514 [Desarmillaria tabescens]
MQTFLLIVAAIQVAVVSSAVTSFLSTNSTRLDGCSKVDSSLIWVGIKAVELATVSCASTEKRALTERCPITSACEKRCTTSCNHVAGVLSPIGEDCATIVDAINIFSTNAPNNFTVKADHTLTLTYESCNYFFANSGTGDVEYCWSDFAYSSVLAGKACFPPVQPFSSEGLCTGLDGTWAAGASHS